MNTERASKLLLQVGSLDEKITNLQAERNDKIAELTTLLGIGTATIPLSTNNKQKAPKQVKGGEKLGDRILTWLAINPGKSAPQISVGIGEKPARIGLAIHHLTHKNLVFSDNGQYFVSVPLVAAAKTAPGTTNTFDEDLNF